MFWQNKKENDFLGLSVDSRYSQKTVLNSLSQLKHVSNGNGRIKATKRTTDLHRRNDVCIYYIEIETSTTLLSTTDFTTEMKWSLIEI